MIFNYHQSIIKFGYAWYNNCFYNLKCELPEKLCLTYCKGLVHCGPSSNNLHMKKTQLKINTCLKKTNQRKKNKRFFVSLLGFTLLCRTMKDKLFINSVLVHYQAKWELKELLNSTVGKMLFHREYLTTRRVKLNLSHRYLVTGWPVGSIQGQGPLGASILGDSLANCVYTGPRPFGSIDTW